MTDWYFSLKDIFEGTYTLRIITFFFELLWLVGPYFILSILINAFFNSYLAKKMISFSTGYKFIDVFIAASIGLISPLPTYVAVPIGVSLFITGIPFTAVVAFMIASPLMNPGIFYLTWTQLGLEIALVRVFASLFLAVGGGYLASLIFSKINPGMLKASENTKLKKKPVWLEFWRSFHFLGKYFLTALFISAVIKALIPAELIIRILGGDANMSLIAAITLGVPFYSCGGAAIPLVEVLSEMGMNKGAILAFFIAGPSTKLETIYIYKSLFGGYQIVLFYLCFSLLGAFLSGFLYLNL